MARRMFFCTIADQGFASRALALYGSLLKHSPDFCLFVLCVDSFTERAVAGLKDVVGIPLASLEAADSEFRNVRESRTLIEYCCTAKPAFLLHLFERFPEIDVLTYLDADLFFFSNPTAILRELGSDSILITGYDASAGPEKVFGVYNAGLIAFRRSVESTSCLARWREQCIEWCFHRKEVRGYLDENYLKDWPAEYGSVRVSRHVGINAGRGNIKGKAVTTRDGAVFFDDVRLSCFHFRSVLTIRTFLFHSSTRPGAPHHRWKSATSMIYHPYLLELRRAILSGKCCASERHIPIRRMMELGGLVIVFGGLCVELYSPALIAVLRRSKRLLAQRT